MVTNTTLHFIGDIFLFAAAAIPILTYGIGKHLISEIEPGKVEIGAEAQERLYVGSLVADFLLALSGFFIKSAIYIPNF